MFVVAKGEENADRQRLLIEINKMERPSWREVKPGVHLKAYNVVKK